MSVLGVILGGLLVLSWAYWIVAAVVVHWRRAHRSVRGCASWFAGAPGSSADVCDSVRDGDSRAELGPAGGPIGVLEGHSHGEPGHPW